jgi:hypothetical protein
MTTKTKEDVIIGSNGKVERPTSKHLTPFQAKYMKRLVANFERAKAAVDAAQSAANEFIVACGEEEGITLGQDGWTFDIDALAFVRQAGGADGNDSRS